MSSAEYSCKLSKPIFAYRQTVWTQIRLLLKEQSDLGPHCLQKWLLKSQADDKAEDNCCDGSLRIKRNWYTFKSVNYVKSFCSLQKGIYYQRKEFAPKGTGVQENKQEVTTIVSLVEMAENLPSASIHLTSLLKRSDSNLVEMFQKQNFKCLLYAAQPERLHGMISLRL